MVKLMIHLLIGLPKMLMNILRDGEGGRGEVEVVVE